MRIRRTFTFLFLIFVLSGLPGCGGGNNTKKAHSPKNKNRSLKTSLDLPDEINNQKLSKIGLSSEVGELLAVKEDDENSDNPSQPDLEPTVEEKIVAQATANTQAMADSQGQSIKKIQAEAEEPSIEFHFEDADLEMLINQISELFDVIFISDDSITPMLQGAKTLRKNKISFKTQRPLTRKEAWDIFLTFLEISGFTVISESSPKIKRIVTLELARKSPLPAFIGVPPSALPNSDEMVRYVYFIENAATETISTILAQLKAPTASVAILQEMKAFLITDRAYNIKSLMNVIKELDKVTMPQAMSVIKLKRADAVEVEQLYRTLAGSTEKDIAQQRFNLSKKASPGSYFPDNVGIFAEKRTNSLILLGPQDAIKRIEDFITQSIDIDLTQPYSPLQVLPLRYADASTVARIMTDVTAFGANSEAGKNGGVRGGDKYMKPITFTAEPETNRLIIKGDYEDFLRAKEVIMELDAPQPQVAIEVLLLSVALNEQKQLGTVLRSREPGSEGFFGTTAKFQTSGLFGTQNIAQNSNGNGVNRLLGNLLDLVSTSVGAGNTIISLGDSLSTWAIIQALETASNVQVLANPFLIATNKTEASVSLGEIRRVTTGTIIGSNTTTPTVGDAPAELKVIITPQINSDGMIVLNINVRLSQFVGVANPDAAVRTLREIKTKTIVTNKEVLALGGLIQNNIESSQTKVPILGDIPILGWLFKNKQKIDSKSNLLILISSRIIEANSSDALAAFTNNHITDYTDTANEMYLPGEKRDPVNRWFFNKKDLNAEATDEFLFRQQKAELEEADLDKDTVIPIAQNKRNQPLDTGKKSDQQPALAIAQPTRKSKRSLVDTIEADKEVRV